MGQSVLGRTLLLDPALRLVGQSVSAARSLRRSLASGEDQSVVSMLFFVRMFSRRRSAHRQVSSASVPSHPSRHLLPEVEPHDAHSAWSLVVFHSLVVGTRDHQRLPARLRLASTWLASPSPRGPAPQPIRGWGLAQGRIRHARSSSERQATKRTRLTVSAPAAAPPSPQAAPPMTEALRTRRLLYHTRQHPSAHLIPPSIYELLFGPPHLVSRTLAATLSTPSPSPLHHPELSTSAHLHSPSSDLQGTSLLWNASTPPHPPPARSRPSLTAAVARPSTGKRSGSTYLFQR